MALRLDNVMVVVQDLEAAKAFFGALGMELEGQTPIQAKWADGVIGLRDARSEIAMMRTPDGQGKVELATFHRPAAFRAGPENGPVNVLGIRRIMFEVDDLDATLARVRDHGGSLVGTVEHYEDIYRLCYVRGPEGILIGLAQRLS